jgi:hypothetical protein
MSRRALPLLASLLPFVAEAAAPALVPVTGYLTDDAGDPINTQVTLHIKLYTDSTSTAFEWDEVQQRPPDQVDERQLDVRQRAKSVRHEVRGHLLDLQPDGLRERGRQPPQARHARLDLGGPVAVG